MTTATKAKATPLPAKSVSAANGAAPTGLRVSEKLLRDYRQLQDRYAEPQLDELGRDHAAEKLESRILKACPLYPWSPPEIYYWVWSWLHLLAYGEEAKTRRRWQPFYCATPRKRGLIPEWDGCIWVRQYPDVSMIVAELDDDDRRRAIP